MNTIENILKTLSDDEKLQHKDLIQECLDRDLQLKICEKNTKNSIKKLTDIQNMLILQLTPAKNFYKD